MRVSPETSAVPRPPKLTRNSSSDAIFITAATPITLLFSRRRDTPTSSPFHLLRGYPPPPCNQHHKQPYQLSPFFFCPLASPQVLRRRGKSPVCSPDQVAAERCEWRIGGGRRGEGKVPEKGLHHQVKLLTCLSLSLPPPVSATFSISSSSSTATLEESTISKNRKAEEEEEGVGLWKNGLFALGAGGVAGGDQIK